MKTVARESHEHTVIPKENNLKRGCRTLRDWSAPIAASLMIVGVVGGQHVFAADSDVPLMDEVVVTASRQEEKIASVPANVTVITERQIAESPAETVPELLRTTPGIVVNDITGNGRNITVDLRGFGETSGLNTLLLIDGRRVNQADLSGVDWTLIPKDRIQQIEIVHGGRGGVLYGDNASGGVVNIITKKGEDFNLSGGAVVGSYESLMAHAGLSGSTEKLSYSLNGNFRTTDGYRDNSGTDAQDVGLNLEYFATDQFSIALSGGYHQDDTEVPGSLLLSELDSGVSRTSTKTPDDYADTDDSYLQVTPQVYFSDTSYFKFDASVRQKNNDAFFSFIGGSYNAQTSIDTIAASPQLVINEAIHGLQSKIIVGLDYSKNEEDIENESVFFGFPTTAAYDLSKENIAGYGNAEVAVTEKLALSAGFRFDQADYESSSGGVQDSADLDETAYNLGATYQISDLGSAYVSYSRSFRYPVLDEMFSFFTNVFDSSLVPQTTDDIEVGARFLLGDGYSLGVNLFRLETDNELFFNPVSFANENFDGDTIRQGVELKVRKAFSRGLVYGSYTLRDTEINGGIYDGNEIPNVPKHQFTIGGDAQLAEKIRLNIDGSYIGERPYISDFANTVEYQDSYFYAAAKLSYLFEKGSAYLTVRNLFDVEYAEYGGLNFAGEPGVQPSPGINFLIGVTFQL